MQQTLSDKTLKISELRLSIPHYTPQRPSGGHSIELSIA